MNVVLGQSVMCHPVGSHFPGLFASVWKNAGAHLLQCVGKVADDHPVLIGGRKVARWGAHHMGGAAWLHVDLFCQVSFYLRSF